MKPAPDFESRLAAVQGIIWDLDNTLYRFDDALIDTFNVAVGHAVIAAGVKMTHDEAVKLAKKSYLETGYSGRYFVQNHDVDARRLHFDFHTHVDEKIIETSVDMQALFGAVDLKHALVTHGARDWALRVLKHLGLSPWFPPEHVFGLEDYGFRRKSEGADSFVKAIEALQLPPEQLLFVEDTPENLRIPYELGIGTVLIHHGTPPPDPPPHVDMLCLNSLEVLEKIAAVKRGGR